MAQAAKETSAEEYARALDEVFQRKERPGSANRHHLLAGFLVVVHGRPSANRVDNGPEFTAQPFVDWCFGHGIAIHYIQPGKPDQNAYIERFNRTYRTEVLNAHLFESVTELQAVTDSWLVVYNQERPHDRLGRVPPLTFLPEAFINRRVYFRTVYLTGKLTHSPLSRIETYLGPTGEIADRFLLAPCWTRCRNGLKCCHVVAT